MESPQQNVVGVAEEEPSYYDEPASDSVLIVTQFQRIPMLARSLISWLSTRSSLFLEGLTIIFFFTLKFFLLAPASPTVALIISVFPKKCYEGVYALSLVGSMNRSPLFVCMCWC